MTKFNESDAFLKLQAEWKRKLRASGFIDLEDERGTLRIDRCSYGDLNHLSEAGAAERAAYFTLVGRWLHAKVWSRRSERRLWELHCEGVGVRMATIRMRPMVDNSKSSNERRLYAARAEMFANAGSEAMAGAELDVALASRWAEHMVAEGYNPEGDLVESDGL